MEVGHKSAEEIRYLGVTFLTELSDVREVKAISTVKDKLIEKKNSANSALVNEIFRLRANALSV